MLKTGVPQGVVLSPTLFNIYTSDIPLPPPNVQLDTYADDINTLTSHPKIDTAENTLQPYLNQIYNWTIENDLQLNPDKSTSTLFTPDTHEHKTILKLKINNQIIPTNKNHKVLGLHFDPSLKFNTHITKTKDTANKGLNVLKALTTNSWGKCKETIITTYKTITRPIIEYACTVWSPLAAETNINKLQVIQNTALRIATGCTRDTNQQHLHQETQILPVKEHLKLHASNFKQKTYSTSHPLHELTNQLTPPRNMKPSLFQSTNYTVNPQITNNLTDQQITSNMKTIHTNIVDKYITSIQPNPIININPPTVHKSEETLDRKQRVLLHQLRANKSPFLLSYKHKIDEHNYPNPNCPLCKTHIHDTNRLFTCTKIPTNLTVLDLWNAPCRLVELLEAWRANVEAAQEAVGGDC